MYTYSIYTSKTLQIYKLQAGLHLKIHSDILWMAKKHIWSKGNRTTCLKTNRLSCYSLKIGRSSIRLSFWPNVSTCWPWYDQVECVSFLLVWDYLHSNGEKYWFERLPVNFLFKAPTGPTEIWFCSVWMNKWWARGSYTPLVDGFVPWSNKNHVSKCK